jgi:hypothetical protein
MCYKKKREIFAYIVYKKKKKRYWRHSYIDDKNRWQMRDGFITLFSGLRENPDKFLNYFCMRVQLFNEFSVKITDMIKF